MAKLTKVSIIAAKRQAAIMIFEEIVRSGIRSSIYQLLEFYLCFSQIYPIIEVPEEIREINSLSNWPPDIRKVWLKVNQIFLDPEMILERKDQKIYQVFKTKYFSLIGLDFTKRK